MQVLDHGFVELVTKSGDPGLSVVRAARCSFGSEGDDLGERDRKLIAYLMGNGHTSPFRHAHFTFHVKAPLFVFRQWWKHQVGSSYREHEFSDGTPMRSPLVRDIDIYTDTDKGCSWNELSGRYKEMEPEFYMPEKARLNTGMQAATATASAIVTGEMHKWMEHSRLAATNAYQAMLDHGVAKELARLVLPPTIYSECYWTVSLQAILHFLHERLDDHAQWEIRQYAQGVLELIREDLCEMGMEF